MEGGGLGDQLLPSGYSMNQVQNLDLDPDQHLPQAQDQKHRQLNQEQDLQQKEHERGQQQEQGLHQQEQERQEQEQAQQRQLEQKEQEQRDKDLEAEVSFYRWYSCIFGIKGGGRKLYDVKSVTSFFVYYCSYSKNSPLDNHQGRAHLGPICVHIIIMGGRG